MRKRVLVVTHDPALRTSRAALLFIAGYDVVTTEDGDSASKLLGASSFDLVVVGRKYPRAGRVDQQLRENYPAQAILKIAEIEDRDPTGYASQVTNAVPYNVLAAVRTMIG
jgi:DNA-binding response OmpR family regulator